MKKYILCVCVCVCVCVCARALVSPRTEVHLPPLSLEFPRKESWSGLPCPSPGDHPDSRMESASLESLALAGWFFTS